MVELENASSAAPVGAGETTPAQTQGWIEAIDNSVNGDLLEDVEAGELPIRSFPPLPQPSHHMTEQVKGSSTCVWCTIVIVILVNHIAFAVGGASKTFSAICLTAVWICILVCASPKPEP